MFVMIDQNSVKHVFFMEAKIVCSETLNDATYAHFGSKNSI